MQSSNGLLHFIKKLCKREKLKGKGLYQTFTYYIPGPPPRDSGYQEKEFDKMTFKILSLGFEIVSVKTQMSHQDNHCGMWVLLLLKANNENAQKMKLFEGISSGEKIEMISDIHPIHHDHTPR